MTTKTAEIEKMDWTPGVFFKERELGVRIIAGTGVGKSMFMGQFMAVADAKANLPVVIFDTGSTIDNFLWTVFFNDKKFTVEESKAMIERIRYVNMAGMVSPEDDDECYYFAWPIYFRYRKESPTIIADRLVSAFARLHVELEHAQIQGMPRFKHVAEEVGEELIRRGLQLDAAEALLADKEIIDKENTETFRLRVRSLLRDPLQRAIYTTTPPGIDWEEVLQKKLIVLIDFRDLKYQYGDMRRFAVIWTLWSLFNYLDVRGVNYTDPVSVIIDEFKALTTMGSFERQEVFAEDLDIILNAIMRQHNIWLTLAHQQVTQFSPHVRSLLMKMGTQIVGRPETKEDAIALAQELYRIDPVLVKRMKTRQEPDMVPDWDYDRETGEATQSTDRFILHYLHTYTQVEDPEYYSIAEQHHMNAQKLLDLPPFHYFRRDPRDETLYWMRDLPHGFFAGDTTEIRWSLMKKHGRRYEPGASYAPSYTPPAAGSQADGKEPSKQQRVRKPSTSQEGTLE